MVIPGSTLVVFINPIWKSAVGRVLRSTELVLPSFFTCNVRGGAWDCKNKKEVVMETFSHSYYEWLIYSNPWIDGLLSSMGWEVGEGLGLTGTGN